MTHKRKKTIQVKVKKINFFNILRFLTVPLTFKTSYFLSFSHVFEFY